MQTLRLRRSRARKIADNLIYAGIRTGIYAGALAGGLGLGWLASIAINAGIAII